MSPHGGGHTGLSDARVLPPRFTAAQGCPSPDRSAHATKRHPALNTGRKEIYPDSPARPPCAGSVVTRIFAPTTFPSH